MHDAINARNMYSNVLAEFLPGPPMVSSCGNSTTRPLGAFWGGPTARLRGALGTVLLPVPLAAEDFGLQLVTLRVISEFVIAILHDWSPQNYCVHQQLLPRVTWERLVPEVPLAAARRANWPSRRLYRCKPRATACTTTIRSCRTEKNRDDLAEKNRESRVGRQTAFIKTMKAR
jgi:hypothetical protein